MKTNQSKTITKLIITYLFIFILLMIAGLLGAQKVVKSNWKDKSSKVKYLYSENEYELKGKLLEISKYLENYSGIRIMTYKKGFVIPLNESANKLFTGNIILISDKLKRIDYLEF